jgi:outer membrane murein-binding lipoprotein Lpp
LVDSTLLPSAVRADSQGQIVSEKAELRSRVEAKIKQLEADLAHARADAHGASNDAATAIHGKLEEAKTYLTDGWDNWSEHVSARFNEWLK